jgi:TatD DNase family protein
MLADSHCHLDCLDLEPYGGDLQKAIAAARAKDVKYILCPGISIEVFPKVLKIVADDEDLFAALSAHPTEESIHEPSLEELLELGQNKKVVAIGETGLDYYWAPEPEKQAKQLRLFKRHIEAAKYLKKPLIIHARDADFDIIKILKEEGGKEVGGVMHCFTGSLEMAKEALALGFYISFSGIITFKNAQRLRDVAKTVLLDKILIETDAPFLAPAPFRGQKNEPAYLPYIAEAMADLRGISLEEIAKQTTENFLKFCC